MYNSKRDKISSKTTLVASFIIVATLLFVTSLGISNVDASLDLSNLDKVDDIGQSVECVIVVVGCDGNGSVISSGDTIIGSNNNSNDNTTANNTDTDNESGTLTVIKTVECGNDIDPNSELCQAILAQISPDDFTMQIRDEFNNEILDSFDGSSSGTEVELAAGKYNVVDLEKPSVIIAKNNIDQEFEVDIENEFLFDGDCTKVLSNVGTVNIESGQTYTCMVINSFVDDSS